ncbi:MAG: hypothetical protein WD063_00055 [Pirellulales bacterium]
MWFEALEERRLLVIAVADTPNDDALSLDLYGGPGDPDLPGFDNVGLSSTGNASVVYLGGGWALTANHVTIANPPGVTPGGVYFGATNYLVDTSTIHQLHNPDDSLADLKIFKIIGDPGLPAVLPSYIASAPPTAPPDPSEHVIMIGNGFSRGDQHFWTVDTDEAPWVWTEISEPPIPGPFDESGYDLVLQHRIRWGENMVDANQVYLAGVHGFITQFDDLGYTGVAGLTHEGQASNGDSGGPAFYYVDGKWVLSGIMIAISGSLSGQPPWTTLLGSQTLAADVSYYRDEILEIAGVMGRHVFYNDSQYDGHTPGIDANDDGAIATDKVAYLPGSGLAGPTNATSYSHGINGVMIDLASDHGPLTLDDFAFKVGANNAPSMWAAAPTPTDFTVRAVAGPGGSDRVEIIWADGTIANTWLQVTVKGNDAAGAFDTNTGLAASDVFFFGNRIGDTFLNTIAANLLTNANDEIGTRGNTGSGATVTNLYDFNKDGLVNASDQIIVRNNAGFTNRINISSPPAAPTSASDDSSGPAVAFALGRIAEAGRATPDAPGRISLPPRTVDDGRAPRERVFEQLAFAREDEWLGANADEVASVRWEWLLVESASEFGAPPALLSHSRL